MFEFYNQAYHIILEFHIITFKRLFFSIADFIQVIRPMFLW